MQFTKVIEKVIFGEKSDNRLDRRILILISFYGIIIAMAGNMLNILLAFNILLIGITFFALLLITVLFLYARNSIHYPKLAVPFFILSLSIFPCSWFLNGGYDGNTINLMFVYFIGNYVTMPSKIRVIVFWSFLIELVALLLVQHYIPGSITQYANPEQRFFDILFGNILYLIFAFFVIAIIIQNYTSENQKVKQFNDELILKNNEIAEANKKLYENEDKFRGIAEQVPDVLFLTNNDGVITYLSPATTNLFGWTADEMTGHFIIDYLIESDKPEVLVNLQKTLNNENVKDLPLTILRKDGIQKTVEVSSSLFMIQNSAAGVIGLIRDVTEKKIAQEKILKLSKGIEQSPASIIITDIEGNIEYANPKFSEISGYSNEEALGQNPRILFSGYQSTEYYNELWSKILSGESWRGEIYNKKKNGEFYWEFASIFPIKNEAGSITHFIAVKEDITQNKKLEAELIKAKEKAEESDRLKSAFLANMSHEIRTPLNGILGFATLLTRDNLSQEQRQKFNSIIEKSSASLLQIINDILDISKIESKQLEINVKPCNIHILLSDIYALSMIKMMGNNEIKLTLTPFQKNLIIQTDEARVRQIFTNLLENAIKFTSKGEISFGIINCANDKISFFVKDTGIGIPQELQAYVFDRFRQVMSDNSSYRGNGLGLSIVKQLLDLLGGKIEMTSKVDSGSTFTFSLPIKPFLHPPIDGE